MFKFITAALLALACTAGFAATDINKASQAELEAVKGIGPAMATRILEARKTGAFGSWTDVQSRVKGVGDGNARKFSADGLTVNGAAYTGSAEPKAKAPKERAPKKDKAAAKS